MPIENFILICVAVSFLFFWVGIFLGMRVERLRPRFIHIRRTEGILVVDPYLSGLAEVVVATPAFQEIYLGSFNLYDGKNDVTIPGVKLQVCAGTQKELQVFMFETPVK